MDFEPLFQSLVHPGIARAAQYFQDLAGRHELPRRSDFRPSSVRSLLGYIFLIDILPDDYHFSLCGVNMAILFGIDMSNMRLSEMGHKNLQEGLRKTYDAVVAARTFKYVRGRYAWTDKSVDIERLLVPMTDSEGTLTTLFGLTIPNMPMETLILSTGIGAARLEIDEEIDGRPQAQDGPRAERSSIHNH